jgi:hypothetical protein
MHIPERAAVNGYQRVADLRVRTTDPDATPLSKGGEASLGYHDHYVVDGGKARIVLHAFVTPAEFIENRPILDRLRRVQFRYHVHPKRGSADTTYGTAANSVEARPPRKVRQEHVGADTDILQSFMEGGYGRQERWRGGLPPSRGAGARRRPLHGRTLSRVGMAVVRRTLRANGAPPQSRSHP